MAGETIFQNWVFTEFILPFLLVFVVVFAILEKTKVLGSDVKQLDAIVAFVIGLIFVGFAYPKDIVSNMILFLTVALIIVLVFLMIYGFATGSSGDFGITKNLKWVVGIVSVVAVLIALIWSSGTTNSWMNFLFYQGWSRSFWTNALFIVVIAIVLAVIVKKSSDSD